MSRTALEISDLFCMPTSAQVLACSQSIRYEAARSWQLAASAWLREEKRLAALLHLSHPGYHSYLRSRRAVAVWIHFLLKAAVLAVGLVSLLMVRNFRRRSLALRSLALRRLGCAPLGCAPLDCAPLPCAVLRHSPSQVATQSDILSGMTARQGSTAAATKGDSSRLLVSTEPRP